MTPSKRQPPPFAYAIQGEDLWRWRQQAMQDAITYDIPVSEVDRFLQALTPLTRLDLRLNSFKTSASIQLIISMDDLNARWYQRVVDRVPLQYVVGHTHWRDFQISVSPAVLIPRPETELLIDLAIAATESSSLMRQGHWVDLGTGSGAIAIGLATAFPYATIHGVDCSEAALAIAQKNIHDNSALHDGHSDDQSEASQTGNIPLFERIHLHQGSWFSPWHTSHAKSGVAAAFASVRPGGANRQFSGIVSNPPYIPSNMVLDLQPEVTHHEPHLALDGGSDGLDCLRYLISQASTYLVPNGIFLLEMMAGQAETVAQLINHHGDYHSTAIYSDLAGIDRFVLTRCK
ncbi:MAG: HemK/PrmC family methyltransferase [Cyanobacteria bacterium P01_F01_bin.150]